MRVLVCGGRDFSDAPTVCSVLNEIHRRRNIDLIIHGAARGADKLAEEYAISRNIRFVRFKAEWGRYGGAAGPIRNKRMLIEGRPDLVVAFKGGRGTRNMIDLAYRHDVPVLDVRTGHIPGHIADLTNP